jgi:mono/diheme cytochrome c family protein/plastocyanin
MHVVDMRGMVAEAGGWSPANLTVGVGDLVQFRLTSGDVLHGFAIGQMDVPAVDVDPGRTTELAVRFDRPGKYVFYCTNWCGLNHWRMRGTIEVAPASPKSEPVVSSPPLYMQLGLDLDAPHLAPVTRAARPSAARGAALGVSLPAEYQARDYYLAHSPAQLWQALRALPMIARLSDMQVWDLVASVWASNTTPQALATGKQLFAANCAACHGETGAGDGPMASALGRGAMTEFGSSTLTPTNFTDPARMLGASPALLQGKVMRGGMGTGMPYWGPVFSDPQLQALTDYLWTFQMEYQAKP